jgi:hypothetical protein
MTHALNKCEERENERRLRKMGFERMELKMKN